MVGREGLQFITNTTHSLARLLAFNKGRPEDREDNSYKWGEELYEGGK